MVPETGNEIVNSRKSCGTGRGIYSTQIRLQINSSQIRFNSRSDRAFLLLSGARRAEYGTSVPPRNVRVNKTTI